MKIFRKLNKVNFITGQSALLNTSVFKPHFTSVFHLSVQIKKLSLSWNKIGNSGAKALATCLWNIDELDLMRCDITECEELCNAIQSLKRPVSFNLVSRHTVLKFVWYAGVKICRGYWENVQVSVGNISRMCLICIQLDLTTGRKMLFHIAYGNLHFLLKMLM